MSDENNNGRTPAPGGRQPLTLKPRGAGSVSAGTVKQSFSHGRSKTVVVETKRARPHMPGGGGNLAAPSSAEKRLFEPRPAPAPAAARAPGGGVDTSGLSAEERAARQRAIELAQERQASERRAAEERARAEAAAAAARVPPPAPAPVQAPAP
ncbi:IF-2-associated domain-containing protein, partial [Phenylobacterium sp.]|uniref:IF-2-associated domain-containing protein n=1 Tax=Phenylobacterium sp. TaxID=1871053 RepID=UPI002F3FB2EF